MSPAELLLGRIPRSRLDLIKPSLDMKVYNKQIKQKGYHDQHTKERSFAVGDLVFVSELPCKRKWFQGKIIERKGPLTYIVELSDGRIIRRHVDHIRVRTSETVPQTTEDAFGTLPPFTSTPPVTQTPVSAPQMLRRSQRISRPPDRYTY